MASSGPRLWPAIAAGSPCPEGLVLPHRSLPLASAPRTMPELATEKPPTGCRAPLASHTCLQECQSGKTAIRGAHHGASWQPARDQQPPLPGPIRQRPVGTSALLIITL